VTRLHYAASRIGDWRCIVSKDLIDQTTNRPPPRLWLKYNISSTIIRDQHPAELYKRIMENLYLNRRHDNPSMLNISSGRFG